MSSPDGVRIVASWASRGDDADVNDCVATLYEVGDGDVRMDVADVTIWIPRWQLEQALERTRPREPRPFERFDEPVYGSE